MQDEVEHLFFPIEDVGHRHGKDVGSRVHRETISDGWLPSGEI